MSSVLFAQEEESEIIIGNKLFTKNSSWLSLGTGYGYYIEKPELQQPLDLNINIKIKQHYLTAGYFYSGTKFITQYSGKRVHDIHLAYGWRKQSLKWNKYLFIGPGIDMGYAYDFTNDSGVNMLNGFVTPGIFAEYQIAYKASYDMGIGLAVYTLANLQYQTIGLAAIIYLSTAYIDKIED